MSNKKENSIDPDKALSKLCSELYKVIPKRT